MTKSAIIINGWYKLKLYNRSQVRPLHMHLMKTNIVHQAYQKKKKVHQSRRQHLLKLRMSLRKITQISSILYK